MKNKILATALALISSISQVATAAPLDFDIDGTSDLTWIILDSQSRFAWRTRKSTDNSTFRMATLGQTGDQLALAHWSGAIKPELAIVKADPLSGVLKWQTEGNQPPIQFGKSGDIIISGGNFDSDIASDAATVTNDRGRLKWRIRYNMFNSNSSRTLKTIYFGNSNDLPFFANIDGSGDWLGLLQKINSSRSKIIFKNPRTGVTRTNPIPTRLFSLGRPVPITRADEVDIMAFTRKTNSGTEITIINLRGQIIGKVLLPVIGTAVVGDFDSLQPGQEIAIISAGAALSYNPVTTAIKSLPANGGTAVDEINISSFPLTNGPTLPGCNQLKINDGDGGFVWKPNSDTTFLAVAVMPGKLYNKVGRVEVYTINRSFIKGLTFSGCGNPEVDGSLRCNYRDPINTGARFRDTFGSIFLKVSYKAGGCGSYYIADPSKRLD